MRKVRKGGNVNNEIYLLHLNDILSMRLFLFAIALVFLILLLLIFIIAKPLRSRVWYIVLLILGALIVGSVEIIPVQKDINNSSIITLRNVEYQVVESGGLRSKKYTMVVRVPNSEKVYSIKCGTMREAPREAKDVTIVFAKHSKLLLDIIDTN